MTSSLSSNHLLLSALTKRQRSKNPLQAGFTLIELLVVIIIIGILAAVALPAFLNQSDKAKGNSAKSLAAAGAKECQVYLVEGIGTFTFTTRGGNGVTIDPASECVPDQENTFTATVERPGGNWTYSVTVDTTGGISSRDCTAGAFGCDGTAPFKW